MSGPSGAPSRPAERLRLLVVDDQETQILFTQRVLGEEDFEFVVARDGHEALRQARGAGPDVILLDVTMPGMDGIEVAEILRSDPETAAIPIIMVTTRGEADAMERAYVGGCSDYLLKPVQREELVAKIRSVAGRS